MLERYLDEVCADIRLSRPLRIAIDCGNGVAGPAALALFSRLGCEVVALHCEVDGDFPNHHPDPTVPENLRDLIESVRREQLDLGLAFDGDGDRLGVVDERGRVLWPDRQMMLYSRDVLSQPPRGRVVFDVKCSKNLRLVIEQAGGEAVMWKTGHSLIKDKMAETAAVLGGEMSGHVFFKDRWYGFDDALYSAARLLRSCPGNASPPANCSTPCPMISARRKSSFASARTATSMPSWRNSASRCACPERRSSPSTGARRICRRLGPGARLEYHACPGAAL